MNRKAKLSLSAVAWSVAALAVQPAIAKADSYGTSQKSDSGSVQSTQGQEPSLGVKDRSPAAAPTPALGPTPRSETEAKAEEQAGKVGITYFAIRPEAGSIFYLGKQKFTGGVLMDFDVVSTDSGIKFGPSIGGLYATTASGAFFDGMTSSNKDYIFQIPGNLKATYAPDDAKKWNLGLHAGANIIRSTAQAASSNGNGVAFGGTGGAGNLGNSNANGSSWDAHPNVGADIDYALGTNADITLRPDVTFLSQFDMVTATLGFGLKL